MVDRHMSRLGAESQTVGEPGDGDADRGSSRPPQHVGPGVPA